MANQLASVARTNQLAEMARELRSVAEIAAEFPALRSSSGDPTARLRGYIRRSSDNGLDAIGAVVRMSQPRRTLVHRGRLLEWLVGQHEGAA